MDKKDIKFMKANIPFDIVQEGGMYKVQLGKGIRLAIDQDIKDMARSIGGTVYSEGGYSIGSFDNESTAKVFANRVREELDKRDGIRIDKKVYDALLLKLRNAGINVWKDVGLMEKILNNVSPSDIKLLPVDRDSEEYRKIVNDAAVRIENRLAELRRLNSENQSFKSNPFGNYADLNSAANYSPGVPGAHSVGVSAAKLQNKLQLSKDLVEKIVIFLDNIQKCDNIAPESFPESFKKAMGWTPNKNQKSQYIDYIFDNGLSITLRTSDHSGNSRNIILDRVKTDKGVSIVLETPNSHKEKFKDNKWANVKEYVYENPDKNRLLDITKSIFGLFDTGEYIDIAGADHVNISPKPLGFNSGEYYGFVHDNTIYIDPTRFNAETPIHEYTHLWAEALRQQNPKEWNNIVSIMKEDKSLWRYIKKNYQHLQTDNDIADEVLATYSGRQGLERLKEASKKYDNPHSMFEHISRMLKGFWKAVCGFVGVEYKNKEDVADRVLYDFLSEVNPLKYTKEGVQKLSDRMILGHVRTDIPESDILQAEQAAKEVIHDRIVTSSARSFSQEQVNVLKRYSAMVGDGMPSGELFKRLHEDVCKRDDVRHCYEQWKTDVLEELNDIAEGITNSPSVGCRR